MAEMKFRNAYMAVAFAATVGAAITGASLSGETRESSLDEACRFAAWPQIPAQCLTGDVKAEVRVIAIESHGQRALNQRFMAAFDGVTGG